MEKRNAFHDDGRYYNGLPKDLPQLKDPAPNFT
jgi:hypothetical protein